jgi:hypothetical protein
LALKPDSLAIGEGGGGNEFRKYNECISCPLHSDGGMTHFSHRINGGGIIVLYPIFINPLGFYRMKRISVMGMIRCIFSIRCL